MRSVLIAGLSARAAAASAAAAGFAVTAIDAFADLDLHRSVHAVSLPSDLGIPFSADAAARAAAGFTTEAVVYLANFENEPEAVSTLAGGRTLWGNPPDVLRRVRDPRLLMDAFRARGIPAPEVRVHADDEPGAGDWLVKPLASGGGRAVRRWDRSGIPRGSYIQEHVDGLPGSVAFVAAGGAAVPFAVSRQLIGDPAFGADGYRYCGNILAPAADPAFAHDAAVLDSAYAMATAAAASFNLVGVNGIDFIAAADAVYPVEVNPRWAASMELAEEAYGVSVFGVHAAACARAALPAFDLRQARRGVRALGKAILFARTPITTRETQSWLADRTVRDVPHPGERIAAGRPICTIVADAVDAAGCYAALVQRAERLYAELEDAAPLD